MQLAHEHERLLRLVAHAFARADVDLQDLTLDRSTDDGPFDLDLDSGDLGLGLIDGRSGDGQIGLPRSGKNSGMFAGPVAIAGRRLHSTDAFLLPLVQRRRVG